MRRTIRKTYKYIFPVFASLAMLLNVASPVIAASTVTDSYNDTSKINTGASNSYLITGGQAKINSVTPNSGWWKENEASGTSVADSSGNGNTGTASDAGLVGWWKADESSGSSVSDSSGNSNTGTAIDNGQKGWWKLNESSGTTAADSSSFGTTGTITGTTVTTGKYGNGRHFNNGTSDRITLSANAGSTLDITGAITVEAWIYMDATTSNYQGIVSRWTNSSAQNYLFDINSGGKANLLIDNDNSLSSFGGVASSGVIPAGQWIHLAATYDGTTPKMYINGQLDNTGSAWTAGMHSSSEPVYIGYRNGNNSFNGTIDDVRVYNYARTQSQIQDDMNNADPAKIVTGEYGNARSFNSTGEYVTAANSSSLNINGAGSAASIEFWMKTDTLTPTYQTLIYKGDDNTSDCGLTNCSDRQYAMFLNSTGYVGISSTSTDNIGVGQTWTTTATGVITTGVWYHVAAVVDSSAGTVKIYINGTQSGTTGGYSTAGISTGAGDLFIGNTNIKTTPFYGTIDDVRIYSYARSQTEITTDKNNGTPGPQIVSGKYSNARSFNGKGETVEVGNNASLNPSSAITVEYWVKTPGAGAGMQVSKGNWNQFYTYGGSTISLRLATTAGNLEQYSTSSFNDNTWHHFAATWSSSDGHIRVYKDGNLDATSATTLGGTISSQTDPFYIGSGKTMGGYYFPGSLDDVRMYDYARTQSQIQDDMNNYAYSSSGTIQSTNLLSGEGGTVTSVDEFVYNLSSKPAGTTATIQFSSDNTNFYDSTGDSQSSDALTTGTNNTIVIHNLGFTGNTFYYKITFTGDGTNTPVLDDVTVNYTISGNCSTAGGNSTISTSCSFTTNAPQIMQNSGSGGKVGTLTGSSWAQGKYGSARNFNGTSDYITVPAGAGSPLDIDSNPVTMEAWVKFDSTTGNQMIIARGDYATEGYAIRFTGGVFNLGSHGGSNFNGTTSIQAGNWYHVAGVINGSSSVLYVNGKSDQTGTVNVVASNLDLHLGADVDAGSMVYFFAGTLDDVRIYNYARTADQIKEDMDNSLVTTGTAPVLHMNFDDGYTAGVDNGTLTVSTYKTLTVNAGETLTWSPGQSIVIQDGGSIAVNTGGQIKQENLYVLDGNSNKLYQGSPIASTSQPSSNYIRYYQAVGPAVGSGADGSVEFTTNTNLSTWNNGGRSCADGGDGVYYNVSSLTSSTATLASTPSSGCLSTGDYVLLINLRGISTNYANVGHYEILEVSSVSSNTVTFTTSKTKYYGNGASDDTNIGTGATNQIVQLQRVPQYGDATVDDGVTLTATAWNGSVGGVFAMFANGTLTLNTGAYGGGKISMDGKGFSGGTAGNPTDGGAGGGKTYNGTAGTGGTGSGGNGTSGQGGGGGGAGGTNGTGAAGTVGGGGGGGAGYYCSGGGGGSYGSLSTGGDGGNNNQYSNVGSAGSGTSGGSGASGVSSRAGGGGGGGTYGTSNLSALFLGSGGGGGAACSHVGGDGGIGGGIIFVNAQTISVSGYISANGSVGGTPTGSNAGGGGGGSGGSISLNGYSLTLGSTLVTASAGGAGSRNGLGGNGGIGGNGRIAVSYLTALSGTTSPTATATQISLDPHSLQQIAGGIWNTPGEPLKLLSDQAFPSLFRF